MKKFILFLIFCLPIFATDNTVDGQRNQNVELVTWNVSTSLKRTHGIILAGIVYIDSVQSATQTYVRVDNTADSCSNPFWLVRPSPDSLGKVRPTWENRVFGSIRSVDKDSSTFVLRVQTRERVYDQSTAAYRFTPWTRSGSNSGSADVSVTDAVTFPNIGVTTVQSQYVYFSVAGLQGRFCPDNNASTAAAAGDTVHFDSLHVYIR